MLYLRHNEMGYAALLPDLIKKKESNCKLIKPISLFEIKYTVNPFNHISLVSTAVACHKRVIPTSNNNMRLRYILMFLLIYNVSNAQMLKECSSCSAKELKTEQLKGLSIDETRLLINEISARNGYRFDQSRFRGYFEAKPWYKPKGDNQKVSFNAIEKHNIKLLQQYSQKLKAERSSLVNQLQTFKALVSAGNSAALKAQFGFTYEQPNNNASNEQKLLREVFKKINLSDINYYKHNGLNSILSDNGYVKTLYELSIAGNSVNLIYNFMSHSKIIKDLDEFSDYHSENEFMYNWQFEFRNGQLKFVRLAVAG
jgi:hypothetical protein